MIALIGFVLLFVICYNKSYLCTTKCYDLHVDEFYIDKIEHKHHFVPWLIKEITYEPQ